MASHLTNLRREFRPMLRLALPLVLAELGWMAMGVVDTIMAGRLGAAAAMASPPDLILCDVHLRGESGLETCQQIKRQPGLENVPVMYLSAAQLPDIIRRSDAAGGIYWLRKPFDANV